jgi:hypothetical protein
VKGERVLFSQHLVEIGDRLAERVKNQEARAKTEEAADFPVLILDSWRERVKNQEARAKTEEAADFPALILDSCRLVLFLIWAFPPDRRIGGSGALLIRLGH